MNTLSGIKSIAHAAYNRVVEARRRREALRVIERLPPHIRKDIGYLGYPDIGNTV
ncbi:MAG TPA: hypothetical protein VFB16_10825 [Bauldia sp.]|nr:hypothetical protein [Bauldia sp.]